MRIRLSLLLAISATFAVSAESLDESTREAIAAIRAEIDARGFCSVESVATLERLAEAHPDSRTIAASLSQALLIREDWDALVALHGARPGNDPTPAEQLFLAKLLVRAQRYDDAAQIADPLTDAAPGDPELAWVAAFAAFSRGRYERAATILDRCWEPLLAAGRIDSRVLRGLIHFYAREYDPAVAVLQPLLEKVPGHVPGNNAMGRVLAATGRTAEARVYLDRARLTHEVRNEDEARKVRLSALSRALSAARAGGRVEECERLVAEMLPEADEAVRSRLYLYLAEIYLEAGRAEDAEKARARAVRLPVQGR